VPPPDLLDAARIEQVLARLPGLTVGVVGDLFLDRYLDLDASLTEVSLETGLDAYQVVDVRPAPGAAGTVINNLVALGIGRVQPVAVIGDDGEGYELRRCLARLRGVDPAGVFAWPGWRTPTYTKPMLQAPGQPARELNRLDIHNRSRLPDAAQDEVLRLLDAFWPDLDALLVLDQVSLPDCGVVTGRVRERLAELGERNPDRLILADSREHIGSFRNVSLKPNVRECSRACGLAEGESGAEERAVRLLAGRTGRVVFCTRGERGQRVAIPGAITLQVLEIPGYPVAGPIDPVGAGDSTSAGIACALAAGLSVPEAAAFGNLVASITVQQLGTTGTASPEQVRQRWREVSTPDGSSGR
jgi:bifunctional ADP-heptose synthase (sugar kinase/adenylyltransferase)